MIVHQRNVTSEQYQELVDGKLYHWIEFTTDKSEIKVNDYMRFVQIENDKPGPGSGIMRRVTQISGPFDCRGDCMTVMSIL